MAKMGNEENPLDRQCEMLENEFMGLIHRAYEEYDLPQDAIWGVMLKALMRELIYNIGSEYFIETEEDDYEGEE